MTAMAADQMNSKSSFHRPKDLDVESPNKIGFRMSKKTRTKTVKIKGNRSVLLRSH